MLSTIFCDPMDWDDPEQAVDEDDTSSSQSNQAECPQANALSSNLQSLADSLQCSTIATVSVTKHVVQETGQAIWTVDKVSTGCMRTLLVIDDSRFLRAGSALLQCSKCATLLKQL